MTEQHNGEGNHETEEERIKRWPFATQPLFLAPDSELIEAHGIALLCRALLGGRITAFVGSGASMAYGRLSWINLIKEARQAALDCYKKDYEKNNRSNPNHDSAPINKLKNLLENYKVDESTASARLLIIYQIAGQLYNLVKSETKNTDKATGKLFHNEISNLIGDDKGHLKSLLKPLDIADDFVDEKKSPITELDQLVFYLVNFDEEILKILIDKKIAGATTSDSECFKAPFRYRIAAAIAQLSIREKKCFKSWSKSWSKRKT